MDEFVRITKAKGLICFTINEAIYINHGFKSKIDNLVNENKLYSAGFDVYEKEPPEMSEEKNRSKVITLPHLGASTKEAQARAGQQLVENIKNILNEDLSSVVNKNLK